MGIVCLLFTFVLRALRVSRDRWVLALAPLLMAYTLATGARASAVRACIMAIIYYLAPLVGRRADVPSGIAAAAVLILAWAPAQLVDVGFIFSFVVVTGIVALYPLFEQPLRRLWAPDPFRLQPENAGMRIWRGVLRYLCGLAAVSCSAWLASAPLTAYFFGWFAPVALVSNLLVIPLAFLIVVSGSLSLVAGSIWMLLADVFNHASLALVSLLVAVVRGLAKVPFGSMAVPVPPLWVVFAWYAVLGAVLVFVRKRARSKCKIQV